VIGTKTQTSVRIMYLKRQAKEEYVKRVRELIEQIDIPMLLDSGTLQNFLNKRKGLFPKVGVTEKADRVCANIVRGKICILVEGSNFALILPYGLQDFIDSNEDHYQDVYGAAMVKTIRYISILINILICSLYLLVISRYPAFLPPRFLIVMANSRIMVPFSSFFEVFGMLFILEILMEASIRLPKQIGPAIGIVGALVIGEAAVSAGLASYITVMIVALSTMASFVMPDKTMYNVMRILKFMTLIFTGLWGDIGFIIACSIILTLIFDNNNMGYPYFPIYGSWKKMLHNLRNHGQIPK